MVIVYLFIQFQFFQVTNFLFFLGKVAVTTGLGLIAFWFFSNPVPSIYDPLSPNDRYTVEYYFVPIIIVCVATYFLTTLFFGVYSIAVDTLFLCARKISVFNFHKKILQYCIHNFKKVQKIVYVNNTFFQRKSLYFSLISNFYWFLNFCT